MQQPRATTCDSTQAHKHTVTHITTAEKRHQHKNNDSSWVIRCDWFPFSVLLLCVCRVGLLAGGHLQDNTLFRGIHCPVFLLLYTHSTRTTSTTAHSSSVLIRGVSSRWLAPEALWDAIHHQRSGPGPVWEQLCSILPGGVVVPKLPHLQPERAVPERRPRLLCWWGRVVQLDWMAVLSSLHWDEDTTKS